MELGTVSQGRKVAPYLVYSVDEGSGIAFLQIADRVDRLPA